MIGLSHLTRVVAIPRLCSLVIARRVPVAPTTGFVQPDLGRAIQYALDLADAARAFGKAEGLLDEVLLPGCFLSVRHRAAMDLHIAMFVDVGEPAHTLIDGAFDDSSFTLEQFLEPFGETFTVEDFHKLEIPKVESVWTVYGKGTAIAERIEKGEITVETCEELDHLFNTDVKLVNGIKVDAQEAA